MLAYAPTKSLKELADRCLEGTEAEVVSPPRLVLLMTQVRETVDGELFNLGEVLATSCEVSLNGNAGWGMVLGDDPERSLCIAALDATVRGAGGSNGVIPAVNEVLEELELQLASVREACRGRWDAVAATRVEFEEIV